MNPHVRSLATALALVVVAAAYLVYQSRMERPGPPRPSSVLSAARPTTLPSAPPTARDILDRAWALDLRDEQFMRLQALDRVWKSESSGLEARIQEAEREFSHSAAEAQGKNGANLRELQERSGEFSRLSAELRQRRLHHSDAALGVLYQWQRQRLGNLRPVDHRAEGQ
jgi:hypothetical protein